MQNQQKHSKRLTIGKPCWRFFIVMFLLVAQGNLLKAQGISLSPSRLFFSGEKGQELTQQVTLTNSSKVTYSFKASLMDWGRDSTGEKHYEKPGTQPLSNAAWLEVMPNMIEIAPGTKRQVTVTLHVPKDAQNTVTRSMLFFTQINEQVTSKVNQGHATIGVIVKLEFGVHVYYTPPQMGKKDLDFLSFYNDGIKPSGNAQVRRVAVKVKNKGEAVTDGFISFEVTNKTTGEETKIPAKAISMLPNDEQVIYLDLPVTFTGKYLLVALLDGGEETNLKVAKKELDFGN